eukprot:COSAG05_NODE_1686_length_4281_cov_3.599474_1_plen_51_part_10
MLLFLNIICAETIYVTNTMCHGVSSVQGRIVGPVGLGVYIHRSMVVCHLSV